MSAEDKLGRRVLLALIDGALPMAAMWAMWELQDETSRLRTTLDTAVDRARAWRDDLAERRRARLVDELIASATTTTEGATS